MTARRLDAVTGPDPFEVPGVAWTRLGPGLTRVRRLLTAVALAVVLAVLGLAAYLQPGRRGWWVALVVGVLAGYALAWRALGRTVRAWGYAERDGDLVVRRGALWQQIDVVPYGRMQMVDVTAGPMERAFGLATVRMHTASPSTRARIPGLDPQEASRLRDRLTRRGEAQAAGL